MSNERKFKLTFSPSSTASILSGHDLRQLRDRLAVSQSQFAPIIGLTKSHLSLIEWKNLPVPKSTAERARAVEMAKHSGVVSDLPKKKATWRKSVAFKQEPPFTALPTNGTACGCGDPRCHLGPVRDGDWPNRGHLWIFQGKQCWTRVYLDAGGKKVPSPRRAPVDICISCGRARETSAKYSKHLGEMIFTRRCRPQPSDPPSLQHDPTTHWWKRNGRMVALPQAALDKLHSFNTRSYAVPRCELPGCPRHGKSMARSAVLRLASPDSSPYEIATYRCEAVKAHTEYRVLPRGEAATHLGMGRYRWTDGATGNTLETAPRKRPIRKDRVMPNSECLECHAPLRAVEHERKVMKIIHGQRRWKGRLRCWKAQCTSCSKVFFVRSDGEIKAYRDSRWYRARGGRPVGMGQETREDATILLKLMAEFEQQRGPKKGALIYASKKVYGSTVSERVAFQRANKTLTRYRSTHPSHLGS
jgi:hypothetical protein